MFAVARAAASLGRRVLLILMDVSKTGLISPSPACALDLKRLYPEQVEVFVDACQLRLAPSTLRAYLEADCMVALTGSKFMTGPTFSAALLAPDGVARRLSAHRLPMTLASHTARADWPQGWPGSEALPEGANFGLALRWQAALDEMAPFWLCPPNRSGPSSRPSAWPRPREWIAIRPSCPFPSARWTAPSWARAKAGTAYRHHPSS